MSSLFHDGATHWSDRIVRLSFTSSSLLVMTALPFWRGLLVRRDTDREPRAGETTARPRPWGGWKPVSCWVMPVMFDVVYQEGNALCVKRKPLRRAEPTWVPQTQSVHTRCIVAGGRRAQLRSGGSDLWSLHDLTDAGTLHDDEDEEVVAAAWRPEAPRANRAICLPLPCSCAKDIWQRPDWHTPTLTAPVNDSNTAGNVDSRRA